MTDMFYLILLGVCGFTGFLVGWKFGAVRKMKDGVIITLSDKLGMVKKKIKK